MSKSFQQSPEEFPSLVQSSRVRGRRAAPAGPPSQSSNAGRGRGWERAEGEAEGAEREVERGEGGLRGEVWERGEVGERGEGGGSQAPLEGHSVVANAETVTGFTTAEQPVPTTRASSAASRANGLGFHGGGGGGETSGTAEVGEDGVVGAAASANSRGFFGGPARTRAGRGHPSNSNRTYEVAQQRRNSVERDLVHRTPAPREALKADEEEESRASGSSSNPEAMAVRNNQHDGGPYMRTRGREAMLGLGRSSNPKKSNSKGSHPDMNPHVNSYANPNVASSGVNGTEASHAKEELRDADGDYSMEGGEAASAVGSQSSDSPSLRTPSQSHRTHFGKSVGRGGGGRGFGKAFSSTAGGGGGGRGGTGGEGEGGEGGAIDSPIEAHSSAGGGGGGRRRGGWGGGGGATGAGLKFVQPTGMTGQQQHIFSAEATSAGSSMGRSFTDHGSKRNRERAKGPVEEGMGEEVDVESGHDKMDEDVGGSERGERGERGQQRGGRGQRGGLRSGGRGAGGGTGESPAMEIEGLGRTLTAILRHRAVDMGLEIRPDGYVRVADILRLKTKTRSNRLLASYSVADVHQAVAVDNKQRLGLMEENGVLFIRANQGHSLTEVASEHLLKLIENPEEVPVCVHGTYRRHLNSIFRTGLSKMSRNHIHFAKGLPRESGVISGMRSSCEVLIFLDLPKVLRDNKFKLYVSDNNVVLSEGINGIIPKEYFCEVKSFPDMKPIPIP